MSKRPSHGQRQPGDKPNPKLCSHRSVVVWPETDLGSCTACGQQLRRRYMGLQVYWEPIPEQRRLRALPPVDPAAPIAPAQLALIPADQLPPTQWQTIIRGVQDQMQRRKERAE